MTVILRNVDNKSTAEEKKGIIKFEIQYHLDPRGPQQTNAICNLLL